MPDTKKYMDSNGLLYFWQKLKTLFANKVDKEEGKGLSSNDFTNDMATKLSGISASAEENVIETVKVNNADLTVTNKAVNITVPTNNNQLTNGAGYQTASDVSTAISSAISGISGVSFSVVQSLPQTGEPAVIYLVAHSHGNGDAYDEYIYVNNAFEKIGSTDVDLSGYLQANSTITNAEIDTIVAS